MVARTEPNSGRKARVIPLRTGVDQLAAELNSEARAVKDQITAVAEGARRSVKDEAEKFLVANKARAAASVGRIGSVVHQAARVLEAGDIPAAAEYVDMAADAAIGTAKYLEETDLSQMTEDAADIVRRHPVPTLALLLLGGLAASRLIKVNQNPGRPGPKRPARRG